MNPTYTYIFPNCQLSHTLVSSLSWGVSGSGWLLAAVAWQSTQCKVGTPCVRNQKFRDAVGTTWTGPLANTFSSLSICFANHLLLVVYKPFCNPGNSASSSQRVFLSLHKAETQLGSHNIFKLASFRFRFFKNLFTLCFKTVQKGLSLFTTQPASFWGRE